MVDPALIDTLGTSLKAENTSVDRERWARYIIENKISLIELAKALLYAEKVISMRFMWLVGHICDLDPRFIFSSIPYFFSVRKDIKILNYERSLAKLFCLSGIPSEIEGEAINEMLFWLTDAQVNVSTKSYCVKALYQLSEKYPEMKNELKLVARDQLTKNTKAFDKLLVKWLTQLN